MDGWMAGRRKWRCSRKFATGPLGPDGERLRSGRLRPSWAVGLWCSVGTPWQSINGDTDRGHTVRARVQVEYEVPKGCALLLQRVAASTNRVAKDTSSIRVRSRDFVGT